MARQVVHSPSNITMVNTIIWYSLYTFIGLLGYFTLMELTGMHRVTWLRYVNFIIVFWGVYKASRHYLHGQEADFIALFFVGLLTALGTGFLFTVAIMVYLGVINPDFLAYLQANEPYGSYLTPFTAGIIVFGEIGGSGLIFAYTLAFYFYKETTPHES